MSPIILNGVPYLCSDVRVMSTVVHCARDHERRRWWVLVDMMAVGGVEPVEETGFAEDVAAVRESGRAKRLNRL